ncbi:Regulator of chromosome condensation [Portunus trituberculatus]|uniref:Regulator of chromosome condensation n=1 Tax=Portunus trituberculatus TaxID=210409 RepID=A0A5B7HPG6_PORTR|nr:Regulator of chromosome condensation [Portunus trituberculatus]
MGDDDTNQKFQPVRLRSLDGTLIKEPTPVTSLEEHKAKSVSAGECVSLAVVEASQVFGFGNGTNNQLAQGDDDDQLVPVALGGKKLAERNVATPQAGGQHSHPCRPKVTPGTLRKQIN